MESGNYVSVAQHNTGRTLSQSTHSGMIISWPDSHQSGRSLCIWLSACNIFSLILVLKRSTSLHSADFRPRSDTVHRLATLSLIFTLCSYQEKPWWDLLSCFDKTKVMWSLIRTNSSETESFVATLPLDPTKVLYDLYLKTFSYKSYEKSWTNKSAPTVRISPQGARLLLWWKLLYSGFLLSNYSHFDLICK